MKGWDVFLAGGKMAALQALDPGFFVAIFAVLVVVILMNVVFWGMKPKDKRDSP